MLTKMLFVKKKKKEPNFGGKTVMLYVDLDTALREAFLFESIVLLTSYESEGTRLWRQILKK